MPLICSAAFCRLRMAPNDVAISWDRWRPIVATGPVQRSITGARSPFRCGSWRSCGGHLGGAGAVRPQAHYAWSTSRSRSEPDARLLRALRGALASSSPRRWPAHLLHPHRGGVRSSASAFFRDMVHRQFKSAQKPIWSARSGAERQTKNGKRAGSAKVEKGQRRRKWRGSAHWHRRLTSFAIAGELVVGIGRGDRPAAAGAAAPTSRRSSLAWVITVPAAALLVRGHLHAAQPDRLTSRSNEPNKNRPRNAACLETSSCAEAGDQRE